MHIRAARRPHLFFALGGTGVLIGHHLLLHHAEEALLGLRVEGHSAFGQLLDAHGVVPLSRQHVLATTGLLLIHHQQITTPISEEDSGGRDKQDSQRRFILLPTTGTYRHNSELHFVGNVQLALLQDLAEVEEHPSVPVHALDEAEAVADGSDHALQEEESACVSVKGMCA